MHHRVSMASVLFALALAAASVQPGCGPTAGVHELDDVDYLLIPAGSWIVPPDGERLTWYRGDEPLRIGIFIPNRFAILITPTHFINEQPPCPPTSQPEAQ